MCFFNSYKSRVSAPLEPLYWLEIMWGEIYIIT